MTTLLVLLALLVGLLLGLVPAAVLRRREQEARSRLAAAETRLRRGRRRAARATQAAQEAKQARAAAAAAAARPADISQPAVEALGRVVADGDRPHVVLTLQGFDARLVFAGVRTTVLAAAGLAAELGLPLRVLVCHAPDADHDESLAALATLVREDAGQPALADTLRLSTPSRPDEHGHHRDDVWVATYWTTAWALKQQLRRGLARRERVVYLVQDFEPGFFPWGPLYAKAFSTYDAGFRPLVNSMSLSRYVGDLSPMEHHPETAFAPALDPAPLVAAAARWSPPPEGVVRVLFYARPSKPRNMYATGLEALRTWADALPEGHRAVVRLAGEDITDEVDLGPRATVELCGKLSYDAYYDLLADTDLGLALMLSPHPGHLALEMPGAGIPTVTNDFAGYREAWFEGLTVAGTDADAIAAALGEATTEALALEAHVPGRQLVDLGGTLDAAVAHVATSLRT